MVPLPLIPCAPFLPDLQLLTCDSQVRRESGWRHLRGAAPVQQSIRHLCSKPPPTTDLFLPFFDSSRFLLVLLPPRLRKSFSRSFRGMATKYTFKIRSIYCPLYKSISSLACSLASILWSLFTSRVASNARYCTAWLLYCLWSWISLTWLQITVNNYIYGLSRLLHAVTADNTTSS